MAAPKKVATPASASSGLDNLIQALQKSLGKEIVHVLTEEVEAIPVIPSGIIALDLGLGCGGLPKGRICEFYGPEMSGKTTLALQFVAQAQKDGLLAFFIDAEHAFDPGYAEKLGVNLPLLAFSQPDSGEQALSAAEIAIANGAGIIVVDSVAALVPQAELEGEMGDAQMGLQARLMSQALRKITAAASKHGCTVIFINQLRMKIGVMFGNPETTTGGHALKFYASVRIDIRKGKALKKGDEDAYGQETTIKIVKNKCAPPFRTCSVDLIYGEGFDRVKSLLDAAIERGVVAQEGAWIKFKEDKWQGMNAAKEALAKDPAKLAAIAEAL